MYEKKLRTEVAALNAQILSLVAKLEQVLPMFACARACTSPACHLSVFLAILPPCFLLRSSVFLVVFLASRGGT